jgi:hypothetical protein
MTKQFFLQLNNLQFFSEELPPGDEKETPPAFSIEDVLNNPDFEKFLQSREDKIRTEYSKKLSAKDKELADEKKSKLSEQEKLELAHKELEEKTLTIQERENKLFAIGALGESELPSSFLPFVTASNEEETTEKITALKAEFDKAVAAKVEDTFKGTGRTHKKGAEGGVINAEQFNKMGYQERVKLANEDPDAYNKLTSGE